MFTFGFGPPFGPDFRTLYCNPDGKVVTPSFKAFSARNAFPASVVPPAAARFAEESAQEDDEERNERAEEFFCRRREGHFLSFVALLKRRVQINGMHF